MRSRSGEISSRTYAFEEWALYLHLQPYFTGWALADIDIEAVDEYRRFKVQQSNWGERRSRTTSPCATSTAT
ncbi:MAG: hypothetical protein ITG02_15030 [Patulibacter sp.]|nr:hypothetical protein [Patulibacter sp.]